MYYVYYQMDVLWLDQYLTRNADCNLQYEPQFNQMIQDKSGFPPQLIQDKSGFPPQLWNKFPDFSLTSKKFPWPFIGNWL